MLPQQQNVTKAFIIDIFKIIVSNRVFSESDS